MKKIKKALINYNSNVKSYADLWCCKYFFAIRIIPLWYFSEMVGDSKKPYFYILRIFLIGFVLIVLANCNNESKISQNNWLNFHSNHVDSIWKFILEFRNQNELAETAVNEINRLRNNPTNLDSANKLLAIIEVYLKNNPDPTFYSYFFAMKCMHSIIDFNQNLVHYWHQKWLLYEPFASLNTKISHSIDMGFFYYKQNKFDSAVINFSKSLDISEMNNDKFYRKIILINLGATYYNLNMYNSANECFSKALILIEPRINNVLKNQELHEFIMLINNIMASLNMEKKYEETFVIFDKYKSYLDRSDLNEMYKILFRLNGARALIKSGKNLESQYLLSKIKPLNPSDENYSLYIQVKSNLWLNLKKYDSFSNCYEKFLPILYSNQPSSVNQHLTNIVSGIKLGLLQVNRDSLLTHYQKLHPQLNNYTSMSNYCGLFSLIEKVNNNTQSSLLWRNKELEYSLAFSRGSNDIKISNIQEEIKRFKMMKKVSEQENIIEKSKIRQSLFAGSTMLLSLLLVSVVLLFLTMSKSRKKQISILSLESELKKKELELLKVQNEKQSNIVKTTNISIQKLSEISETIRKSNLAKNPTMIGIRMNLDRLAEVTYKEFEEEIKLDVFENFDYLREKFPVVQNFNKTSFRVLVLSILENSPRDISKLLNIDMQHVRNIRSKIKKQLHSGNDSSWDWSKLK